MTNFHQNYVFEEQEKNAFLMHNVQSNMSLKGQLSHEECHLSVGTEHRLHGHLIMGTLHPGLPQGRCSGLLVFRERKREGKRWRWRWGGRSRAGVRGAGVKGKIEV